MRPPFFLLRSPLTYERHDPLAVKWDALVGDEQGVCRDDEANGPNNTRVGTRVVSVLQQLYRITPGVIGSRARLGVRRVLKVISGFPSNGRGPDGLMIEPDESVA